MKKFLRRFIIVISILVLAYVGMKIILKPSTKVQGIHFVPGDAIFVFETQKIFNNWNSLVENKSWSHLKRNSYLAGIDSSLQEIDSLVSNYKFLQVILGRRTVYASFHQDNLGELDYLIVMDMKSLTKLTRLRNKVFQLLEKDFRITTRMYHDHEILEIFDREERETYYLSFIFNQLILSFNHQLVEAAIDQYAEPVIGRDPNFLVVHEQITYKDMFRIYMNYKLFSSLNSSNPKQSGFVKYVAENLAFSGLAFDLKKEGDIIITGNTSIDATRSSYFKALMSSGEGKMEVASIAPNRTAMFLSIGFDDFLHFHHQIDLAMQNDPVEYKEIQDNIHSIESRLKIDIPGDLLGWVDDELAILQIRPELRGKETEYALFLKAKRRKEAEKQLDYVIKQIEKNTPGIKFKGVDYKGYQVKYIAFPGLFKLLFGKLIEKIEKPYYTIINDFVIFSNHPQALKSIINDFEADFVLSENEYYQDFISGFEKRSTMCMYVNIPLLYTNLRQYVGKETWSDIEKNKQYVMGFPQLGFQLTNEDNLFETRLAVNFDEDFDISSLDATIGKDEHETGVVKASKVQIDDLDTKKYEEFYENGECKLSVNVKNGQKHGRYREYYPDGSVKLKGTYKDDKKEGIWKFYNENGKIVKELTYMDGNIVE